MRDTFTVKIEIRNLRCIQVSVLLVLVNYELWIDGDFHSVETTLIAAGPDTDNDGCGLPLAA